MLTDPSTRYESKFNHWMSSNHNRPHPFAVMSSCMRNQLNIASLFFPAVGSDICWMFCFLQRLNGVTQVPLLWPPFSFERPSLPHGAAPAADLLTPQRSAHSSLSSWQPGRGATTYLPLTERSSQVLYRTGGERKENEWMMRMIISISLW